MNYLFVVAHPDDELLGAGATIKKLVDRGDIVSLCIMSSMVEARNGKSANLSKEIKLVSQKLGISQLFLGSFPNLKMNTVEHIQLVKYIEECILKSGADAIFTHHPSDLNDDHRCTSCAVQSASRLFQRSEEPQKLIMFAFFEVLSSTDWSFADSFKPNLFLEIGEEGLNFKIETLKEYQGVIRKYPHSRSVESIRGLAAIRGSQAGCKYAEAFECVFRIL